MRGVAHQQNISKGKLFQRFQIDDVVPDQLGILGLRENIFNVGVELSKMFRELGHTIGFLVLVVCHGVDRCKPANANRLADLMFEGVFDA